MPLKTVFFWTNFFLKWPSMLKSMIKKTNILESNLFTTRVLLYNQSIIPSTDVIQLTLTLKMTAQVVETLVNVNNNSPIRSGLRLLGRSNSTYFWNDSWIQTFHKIISGRKEYSRFSRYGHLSSTDSSLLQTVSNVLTKFSCVFLKKKISIIPTLSNTDNGQEISAPESKMI